MGAIKAQLRHEPLGNLVALADSGTWGDEGGPDSGDPVLRSTNITDYRLDLTDPAWRLIPGNDKLRRKLQTGDIIVTKSSGSPEHIGKCCLFTDPQDGRSYYFSNFMLRLRANVNKIDHRWLFYWLTSERGRAVIHQMNSTTSGLRNLSVPLYLQQSIPLPPLPEQKRIAAILDKADAIRRRRQEALAELDEMPRSVFLEMLGDPAGNPKRWPLRMLGEMLNQTRSGLKCGPFGSALSKSEYVSSGIPVFGIDNVQPNRFVEAGSLFITETKYQELIPYSVYPGDILISRAGTVGRMCVAYPTTNRCIIGTNLIRVALDQNHMLPQYMTAIFSYFADRLPGLRSSSDDNAYSFMKTGVLTNLTVPVPPIDVQRKYASIVRSIESLRNGNPRKQSGSEDHCRTLASESEHLFKSLVQRAFRGEL